MFIYDAPLSVIIMLIKKTIYVGVAAALLPLCACIRNDIPYARILQEILTIEPVGMSLPSVIDNQNLSATIYLEENVDIANVSFAEYTFTEGATSSLNLLEGSYDLSSPLSLTLTRYQEYQWTVSAVQEIERYFTIEGQVGATAIDVPGRRVVVRIPDTQNLADLRLTSVKLGPEGLTTMVPDLKPGKINLVYPLEIDVTAHGRTERWTVYAEQVGFVVNTASADAWSEVIWVYGESQEGLDQGFQYRMESESVWTDVPASSITSDGGTFYACIPHVQPLTEYVVRAVAGEDAGRELHVVTQATEILPDGTFDQWWMNGNVWCPWDVDGERFWDTGNKGASSVAASNSSPSDYTPDGNGKSARLETINAILKLAAGSIFTGSFARIDGVNGVLDFGRPWTLRPTRLRGYFQYQAKIIDKAPQNGEYEYLKGRPDSCHIYVALTDWKAPYEIRTDPAKRQLFDPSLPSVIAYGELIYSGNMDSYKEFVIPLVYRSTSRIPSYIQITVSSSKYGDFFTGGVGSLLYVDQFSLDYDY